MIQFRVKFTFGLLVICFLAMTSCTPKANYEIIVDVNMSELLWNHARNSKDADFLKVYNETAHACRTKGGEFIETFFKKCDHFFPNKKYTSYFKANSVIRINSINNVVKDYFTSKKENVVNRTIETLTLRFEALEVSYCESILGSDRIKIGVNKSADKGIVAKIIARTSELEFFETFGEGDVRELMLKMIAEENKKLQLESQKRDTTLEETLAMINEQKTSVVRDMMRLEGSFFSILSKDKSTVQEFLETKSMKALYPINLRFIWSYKPIEYGVEKRFILYACKIPNKREARINGFDIKEAELLKDEELGKNVVSISMTEKGSIKWEQFTKANIGKSIAISLGDVVFSAPFVSGSISGGKTEISGSFTEEEASELAGVIGSGNLPVSCAFNKIKKL